MESDAVNALGAASQKFLRTMPGWLTPLRPIVRRALKLEAYRRYNRSKR